jgi:uncharacterized protein with HEPN domain
MTQHDDAVSLRQMLDHAREAVSLAAGRSRQDLDDDRVLSLAPTQLVQIVGEAANRVLSQRRGRHPEVPWREIIGLRNRLVHGCDAVDLDILWQVLTGDLPVLIGALDRILATEGG